jgi:hypothetical protein
MDPNDLVECYPEIMHGANAWLWGDRTVDKTGTITVTDDGLKHLLRMIFDMRRALFVATMAGTDDGEKPSRDGVRIPFKKAAELMNRTSQVFCEDDLIASGLFVVDGEPVISRSTEVPLLGSEAQEKDPVPAGQETKPKEDDRSVATDSEKTAPTSTTAP